MGQTMRRNLFLLPAIGLAGLILWGALNAVPPIPRVFGHQDKIEHFLAFAGLALWLTAGLGPKRLYSALALSAVSAVGLEVAQLLLSPTRTASLPDILASLAGILAAAVFMIIARQMISSRQIRAA